MKIGGKGEILFCLLLDQIVQVSVDVLTESVEEADVLAYLCCLFLHEYALELVVPLETIPNAKMYLITEDISASFADGFALLPLAEVAQRSLADTRRRKVVLRAVSPFLQVLVNHFQALLKKSQHIFPISVRMQSFDDIGKQALRLHR